MTGGEITAMYVELENLTLDDEVEKERIRLALDNLNTLWEGKSFEELYAAIMFHMQNVLGVKAKYEHYLMLAEQKEKSRRKALDAALSQEVNPATEKGYTRDAIAALIEGDDEVKDLVEYTLIARAVINFMRYLHEIYRLDYERIVNINVNARRAWEAAQ